VSAEMTLYQNTVRF